MQRIDDRLRRADNGVVATGGCDPLVQLANREVVFVGDLTNEGLAALHALGRGRWRQRPVEVVAVQVTLMG